MTTKSVTTGLSILAVIVAALAGLLLVGQQHGGPAQAPPSSTPPTLPQANIQPTTITTTTTDGDCHLVNGYLADNHCTPGATDPRVTQANIDQTICVPGYTKTVRPPVSYTDQLKTKLMSAYGLAGQPKANYELDHLIPLELGGAPKDPANLYPEPRQGPDNAGDKDRFENAYHEAVCAHSMTLADAQDKMAHGGWIAVAH